MARSRNIKPAFFTSEQVADICPLGRLFFIGLWTQADFKGNVEWKPRTLKIQIIPWDDCDIKKIAINLDKSGLIRFYSDGDKIYINIPKFLKHQNPHKNERDKGSETPDYTEAMREALDLKGLTINRDKSGLIPEDSSSDRADSLIPLPDSLILIPEPLKPLDQSAIDHELLFEKFWQSGIRKAKKKDSQKAFLKIIKKESEPEKFTDDLINDIYSRTQNNQFGFDKMHPTTYLNGERWKDDKIIDSDQMVSSSRQQGMTANMTIGQQLNDRSWADDGEAGQEFSVGAPVIEHPQIKNIN